jgi:SAM-dependent methyltransferase
MTMTQTPPDIAAIKAKMKATWEAGDFGMIARSIEPAAEEFIERLKLTAGTYVLDVACGSGNLSIPAAKRGARVVGVDIATNLVEQARARAKAEGVEARFDEGDAEKLPYRDGEFDVVVSMFGVMFAPRPEVAAAELVRVCKPGGTIALANWATTSFAAQMFKTLSAHIPPPPGIAPPIQWGDEAIVRQRLAKGIADLKFAKRTCTVTFPFAPAQVVEHFKKYFGPVNRAFVTLDESRQAALRNDLEQMWMTGNRAQDDTTEVEAEYLEVIAKRT